MIKMMKRGKHFMDINKLLSKIEQNKEKQVDKYVDCIKRVVRNNPAYYKDKKYADKFK